MTTTIDRARLDQLAKVLVAIGPERAAAIIQTFPEEIVPDIADAIVRVPPLEDDDVTSILGQVVESMQTPATPSGDVRYAVGVIERAFGTERAQQVRRVIEPSQKPFGFLTATDPEIAARALGREPTGVAALALASLNPSHAAPILKHLDEELQDELHLRIATLAPISEELYDLVEDDLRRRVGPRIQADGIEEIPGFDVVVGILGKVSKKAEKRVLEHISHKDEALAARIRESLFRFEDLARLDNRVIQEILKSVDTTDLSFALYSADETIRERFMSNLSSRARENLEEEIDYLNNPPARDIKAAQKRIVDTVSALEESGAISIDRGGDDDDDE